GGTGRAGRGGRSGGGARVGGGWGGLARHRVGISSDRDLQNGQAREDGEDDDQGKDQEHDRDEHRDLAPPGGLHEFALGGLAGVLRLSAQDVGQGGAALDRDGHAFSEAPERRERGAAAQRGQRLGDTRAGPDVGDRGGELLRQRPGRGTGDALHGSDGALPRGHREAEQIG